MKFFKQEEMYEDNCSCTSSSEDNDYLDDHHPKQKLYVDRSKRLKASARERRRRYVLNDALERLRRKVPSTGTRSSKLSKIEVLRLAIDYIGILSYHLNYASPSPIYSQQLEHQQLEQHQQQYQQLEQQQILFNNNNNNNNNNYQTDMSYPQQHQHQQPQWNIQDSNQFLEMQHLQELSQLSPMDEMYHQQILF